MLVQGTTYAVVISQPDADASGWRPRVVTGDTCTDTRFFFTARWSAGFVEPGGRLDLLFSVFVGFSHRGRGYQLRADPILA
jgi:hypothetical protein